jgi:hypothetical protein
MILMRANTFRGPLEGVGLKIETFLGPANATSEATAIWATHKALSIEQYRNQQLYEKCV